MNEGKFPAKIENNSPHSTLTNDWVILWKVADLVNVDVSTVAVIQLDEDVVIVVVGPHHRAGVEVAQLAAPVNTDPSAQLQLRD